MISPSDYQCRFIPNTLEARAEITNLYHLARTALSGGDDSRYERRKWAAFRYAEAHPQVSPTAAYKDLEGLLVWQEV